MRVRIFLTNRNDMMYLGIPCFYSRHSQHANVRIIVIHFDVYCLRLYGTFGFRANHWLVLWQTQRDFRLCRQKDSINVDKRTTVRV